MRIDSLKLKDFRNYEALTLTPHPGVNLLFGQNGSGKTNLLEAVHYCALGRSHRTSQDREVVRKGAFAAAVGVTVVKESGRHDVAVKLTPAESRKKQAFLDRKRAPRLSDMMGQLQCVIFSPEDLMIVKEGPALRRRFLDMMLSQLYTPYFVALQQYQKALEQRNALLREARRGRAADPDMLDAFERAMAIPCETIIRRRRQVTAQLAEIAWEKYAAISGRPGEAFLMAYECCLSSDEDIPGQVTAILRKNRADDIMRGVTGFGIHREDVALTLSGREMKLFASQGQIRTAALSMKLAQLEVFRRETGETPVLLLDDVMSELDMTRRTRLLEEISGVQTFVTCTDESDLEGCRERRSYQVRLAADGSASVREETPGERVDPYDLEDPDFT
ncbi:MAG: DNA replication/repair protein RecF [Clostridia bacterium]|nr:DNA replication/repair protein RecF [Clostridia bacterium]